ncbi:hypothetical protein [Pectobacterium versatile]|uniref:hypothetical protein n=1 Tax=Pectobacterium versatile TaxID=2488639 RepID=UPI001F460D38|nr:hypothetical protein [Pectobacterium versatile]
MAIFDFLKTVVEKAKTVEITTPNKRNSVARDMTDPSSVTPFSLGNPFSAHNQNSHHPRR